MGYSLRIHPLVQKDYNEAYNWYEDQQKGLGEKFLTAVHLKINAISNHPENYGSTINKKYREAVLDIFPYVIVFRINRLKKDIYIVAIHHTKKKPKRKFRR